MIPSRASRTASSIGALALTAFALIGCSMDPSGQSIDEACTVVLESVQDAVSAGTSAAGPDAVAEELRSAVAALNDATDEVVNSEVSEILPDLREGIDGLAGALEGLVAEDSTALEGLGTLQDDVGEAFAAFQEICLP